MTNLTLTASKSGTSADSQYIIPTKQRPVFVLVHDYFGYIERGCYKDSLVKNHTTTTFATSYADAVNALHEWIQQDPDKVVKCPKATMTIYSLDGSWDAKDDLPVRTKVYEIKASKARKYLL